MLETIPKIKLLKVPPQDFDFLDFDEAAVLLDAVRSDHPLYLATLLQNWKNRPRGALRRGPRRQKVENSC